MPRRRPETCPHPMKSRGRNDQGLVGSVVCSSCGTDLHPERTFAYKLSPRVTVEAGTPVRVKRAAGTTYDCTLEAFRGTFRFAEPYPSGDVLWISEDQAVRITEQVNGRKVERLVLQTAGW